MADEYLWGATLDKVKKTVVWDPDLTLFTNNGTRIIESEHILFIKQAVLGPEVPDGEVHVIEVEASGYNSDLKVPMVVLKGGVQSQCVLDLFFPAQPVTFKLVKGNGPIYLLGNHSINTTEVRNDDINEELESIVIDDEEEEPVLQSRRG